MDSPTPDGDRSGQRRVRRFAFLAVALLSAALAARGQEASRLEAEAKKLFDSGRFKDAGEKYTRAAEAADVAPDRKGDLYLQSAWAYFISGNSKVAREGLKAAYAARPTLDVPAEFYSPDFAKLAQSVKAESGL